MSNFFHFSQKLINSLIGKAKKYSESATKFEKIVQWRIFFQISWHSRKTPTLITYCEIIHTNFLGHVFRNIKWVNLPTLHRSFRRPFTWLPFIVPHIACWVLSVQFMASQHWQYLPNESRWLLGAHGELLSLLLF